MSEQGNRGNASGRPDAKPGYRVIRQHRVLEMAPRGAAGRLRRALGTAGVYAIGYGNVGSSIYYALGIVAAYALGATPIALAVAGVIFIFTAMTYAEGVSMVPTAGGSVAFARRALNDLYSFVAGWALTLNYIVTTAISAVTAAFYLSCFWPPLKEKPVMAAVGGIAMTLLLMLLNLRGVKETARLNISFAVIDLVTQVLLVVMGLGLVLGGWHNLVSYRTMGPQYWPDSRQFLFAVAIAMVAYVGLESAAQMAEETKVPTRTVPRALLWSVVTVIFMFAALPIVALCAMPPMELVSEWSNDPVAGIASKLPDLGISSSVLQGQLSLSGLMFPWVAILACTILLIAANAGILAGSRITYNMAQHKQLFEAFGRVHPRYNTPFTAIIVVSLVAVGIIAVGSRAPDLLLKLGDLYVFSAMMAFSMAHLSVWLLRIKEPDTPRPFWAWPNVRIKGKPISITATIGFLSCFIIWLVIALSPGHAFGPGIGIPWLLVGTACYVAYRKRQGLDIRRADITERISPLAAVAPAPRRKRMTQEIRSILIPVHSREYAEEMVRIACDLSSLYVADITAVYTIGVPLTLPVDAEIPEQRQEAEEVLEVAYHIADTVYDKKIETVILQARMAGAAIVEYAAEKGTDLILLGIHPEHAQRGDRFVLGPTADYVVRRAPCRVWAVRGSVVVARNAAGGGPARPPGPANRS